MALRRTDVAQAIKESMPHLELALWDLAPFMKSFHYMRKEMVFVECKAFAVEEVAKLLAFKFAKKASIYCGVLKPRGRGLPGTEGSIVVVSRDNFKGMIEDKDLGVWMPTLEERAAELLAFASRGTLPIGFRDAVGAIAHLVSSGELSASKLHRFATRRYMGWLLDVIFYKLSMKNEIEGVPPSHLKAGEKWLKIINEVEELE